MSLSHQSLIQRAKQLGYFRLDDAGICFGVAMMARQAAEIGQLDKFERRLKLIEAIPAYSFAEDLEKLKNKRIAITQNVKNKIGPFRKLTSEELKKLGLTEQSDKLSFAITQIPNFLLHLIAEGKILPERLEEEFEHRKDQLLYNAFVQRQVEQELLKFSEDERIKLDIPAFLEGVTIYHNHAMRDEFFTTNNLLSQNPIISAKYVYPNQLENTESVELKTIDSFSWSYSVENLEKYFSTLLTSINKHQLSKPFALLLTSNDHAITVGYDPKKKIWFMVDANQLPVKYFKDAAELAKVIAPAFLYKDKIATFTTQVFGFNMNQENYASIVAAWKNSAVWQAIHKINTEKLKEIRPNHIFTLMMVAISQGELKTVQKLLQAGVDPNLKRADGTTFLHVAASFSQDDIVEILLKAKGDPNQVTKDGTSPLELAALSGDVETVKKLVNANANINHASNQGGTALFAAAQKGNLSLVGLLLSKGANPNIVLTINLDKLYQVADTYNVRESLKNFLDEKKIRRHTPTVSIKPAEIAIIMGHIEVAATLKEAEIGNYKNTQFGLFSKEVIRQEQDPLGVSLNKKRP